MPADPSARSHHFAGSPRQIGLAIGRALGDRLEQIIRYYLQKRPSQAENLDMDRLRAGAVPYVRSLPNRFQEELEGLALGSNLPFQRIAEWVFVEKCLEGGCSGFICRIDGHAWVGRNNDFFVPELWGYMTVREVSGRIPTISFGMEGDVFAPTGINQEKLWLHHQYLPAVDAPTGEQPLLPGFVFIPEALETCSTLADLKDLLNQTERDGGMMLFAVDGKTEQAAIFECDSRSFSRRELGDGWIAGTNHFCSQVLAGQSAGSIERYDWLAKRLEGLSPSITSLIQWTTLVDILADEKIEGRDQNSGTVYANIACPGLGKLWYTFGGYPAASAGNWQEVRWPW